MLWVIAANVVLLLVAPIGGMTLFNALAALLGTDLASAMRCLALGLALFQHLASQDGV